MTKPIQFTTLSERPGLMTLGASPGEPALKVSVILRNPEEAREFANKALLSGKTFSIHVRSQDSRGVWVALIFAAHEARSATLLTDIILQAPEGLASVAIKAFEDLTSILASAPPSVIDRLFAFFPRFRFWRMAR